MGKADKKKSPKKHTKNIEIHLEHGDKKLMILPSDQRGFKHFKRWVYRYLKSDLCIWDTTAKLYVIDLELVTRTRDGRDIEQALRSDFKVLDYLPFDADLEEW